VIVRDYTNAKEQTLAVGLENAGTDVTAATTRLVFHIGAVKDTPVARIPELIEEGVNGYLGAPIETDRIATWLRLWDEDPSLWRPFARAAANAPRLTLTGIG
jgi:hypothetical protein